MNVQVPQLKKEFFHNHYDSIEEHVNNILDEIRHEKSGEFVLKVPEKLYSTYKFGTLVGENNGLVDTSFTNDLVDISFTKSQLYVPKVKFVEDVILKNSRLWIYELFKYTWNTAEELDDFINNSCYFIALSIVYNLLMGKRMYPFTISNSVSLKKYTKKDGSYRMNVLITTSVS